ncbi:hypothetical protein C5167_043283 [Papaver somniferum]|uniref:CST complex subunit TEN1 n=1 Tax=Papaver somniferum TaxID=3469 RepID=A0A4Y7L684_PAPSO|nr:CST complex subunit TEN1-like [Papaver somniferum]XP_026423470.1 CST complex subunit TEN1-like [Papaver somniferum]RZC80706.1 hypothetical protein C5167_043283 [Papaver somniferum]
MEEEVYDPIEEEPHTIRHGVLVSLDDLTPSSPHFTDGSSIRVTGKLKEYHLETSTALIIDGGYQLKINTEQMNELNIQVGFTYQFIGELVFRPNSSEPVLQARVGRNVDGIDLNLYKKSLKLLKRFQADNMREETTT